MQQKLSSLKPADAWIFHLLQTGELPRSDGLRLPPNMATAKALQADLTSLAKNVYITHMTVADLLTGQKGWGCTRNRASGRGYTFPPLKEMRARWSKRFGATVWENPNADWAGMPNEQICTGNVVTFAQK
jgi:hypothetical protein